MSNTYAFSTGMSYEEFANTYFNDRYFNAGSDIGMIAYMLGFAYMSSQDYSQLKNKPQQTINNADYYVSPNGTAFTQEQFKYMIKNNLSIEQMELIAQMPKTINYETSQLQHEMKHAKDFGIEQSWSKQTGEEYKSAIQNNVNNATDIFKSKYRDTDAYVYINKDTGIGVYTDLSGNYIGGWKLTENQLNYHFTYGSKIK